jgi:hypothetical protein
MLEPTIKVESRLHSGKAPASPANIWQRWRRMAVENTLAYYNIAAIMTVKSFIVHAPGKLVNLAM